MIILKFLEPCNIMIAKRKLGDGTEDCEIELPVTDNGFAAALRGFVELYRKDGHRGYTFIIRFTPKERKQSGHFQSVANQVNSKEDGIWFQHTVDVATGKEALLYSER